MIDAFTDYPFTEIGDVEFQKAPIRKCKLIAFDRNKYVNLMVFFTDGDGDERVLITSIKWGYTYKNEAYYDDAEFFTFDELCKLPWVF